MTIPIRSDFDARLRSRLVLLDAAVPLAAPPRMPSLASTVRIPRRRRVVPLLAAAVLLVGASAVVAERSLYPDIPEPRLEAAIGELFSGVDCLSAAQARPLIQGKLDTLGYGGWTVETRPGADAAPCTAAGVVVPEHAVALFPAAGRVLADALQAAAAELATKCLNRADAMGFLSSVVRSTGLSDFSIHADPWGPQGGPIDQIQAYEAHVAAGCFVYVGTGADAGGRREFYLWGPWP
jgi:hypothetical protein